MKRSNESVKPKIPDRPRPSIGPMHFDRIPAELKAMSRWVLWGYRWKDGDWRKMPLQGAWWKTERAHPDELPRGDNTEPRHWISWADAHEYLTEMYPGACVGLGFCFGSGCGLTGIDIDKCRNPETGEIEGWALAIVRRLNSYTEVTPSLTGLRIWVHGDKAHPDCRNAKADHRVEIYSTVRYFTVTGMHLEGTPATLMPRQAELDSLCEELFGPAEEARARKSRAARGSSGNILPPAEPCLLSDLDIIESAMNARNGANFSDLWNGGAGRYGGDRSAADMALACHLAYWCGPDARRIESLMRQSGLRREKWNRPDYLSRTIEAALAGRTEFYGSGGYHYREEYPGLEFALPDKCKGEECNKAKQEQEHEHNDNDDVAHECRRHRFTEQLTTILAATYPSHVSLPATCQLPTEHVAAEVLAEHRRSSGRYACCRPRPVTMVSRSTGGPILVYFRCEKPTCEGCRRYLIDRELISLQYHFSRATVEGRTLRELNCTEEEWPSVQRAIRRGGGQYVRVREVEGCEWDYYVVTTAMLPSRYASIVCPQETAISTIQTLLESVTWGPRPVSTSRGWGLPKRDGDESDLIRVGKASEFLTPQVIDRISRTIDGGYVKYEGPNNPMARRMATWRFHTLTGWTEEKRQHILSCLSQADDLPFGIVFADEFATVPADEKAAAPPSDDGTDPIDDWFTSLAT